MEEKMALTGEQSDHKVAGIAKDRAAADSAIKTLRERLSLGEAAVQLLTPGEKGVNQALEPESRGIWKTLVRSHLWLAGVGAVIGVLVFLLMFQLEVRFVVDNAMASVALLVVFCTIGGLLIGGALTLRPDHMPFLVAARAALGKGQTVVVVHAETLEQVQQAQDILDQAGLQTVRTL